MDEFDRERRGSNTTTTESMTNNDRRSQQNHLLPFNKEDEDKIKKGQDANNVVNAGITLTEDGEIATGETLPLYEFIEREGHLQQHKQLHQVSNGKEYSCQSGDDYDIDSDQEKSGQMKMINVKKETSV